jgi:hypothetical protein
MTTGRSFAVLEPETKGVARRYMDEPGEQTSEIKCFSYIFSGKGHSNNSNSKKSKRIYY